MLAMLSQDCALVVDDEVRSVEMDEIWRGMLMFSLSSQRSKQELESSCLLTDHHDVASKLSKFFGVLSVLF